MSEMRKALDLISAENHLPAWFKRVDGTTRYYSMFRNDSNASVTVPSVDVDADQTLSWVRSVATLVNDAYVVPFDVWARHVASDGQQLL